MITSNWQDRGALPVNYTPEPTQPQAQPEQKPKRSGWKSWVPMGAGLLATLAAAPFTGGASLAGTAAILGAAGLIGGGAGEWAAQKLNNEKTDVGAIAREGVVSGALSAIPLGQIGRVGRAGGRAVLGAAERAGVRGAERAAAGGARNWVASKLLGAADDTALRATQLSGKKEALKNFEKRFGEDLGSYIRQKGLIGKTGKDVEETVIKGLNKDYGDLVSKIDRNITSSDVLAQNMKKGSSLNKLLNSASSDNKQLADDVFKELDMVFKKEGGAINPQRLNEIKSEYQTLAKNAYKLGNNSKASVNEKVAEYLKKTLQGVSGTDDLARTGKELDKAYKAADLLASAAQNGRGTLSFGLTDAMIAAPGAVVGGVPGMVAAVGAKKAYNSPQVQKFIASKLAQAGERVASTGAKRAATEVVADTTAKGLIKSTAKGQIPGRSLQALSVAGSEPQPELPVDMAPAQYGAFDNAGADQDAANLAALLGATPGGEDQYSRAAMMSDIKRDPKNAKEYMALYEMLNQQPEPLSLSDSAITKITDTEKGLQGLESLAALVEEGGGYAGGKVAGNLRKFNPFDDTFQSQQAMVDTTRQFIGKALEGGVLRKEDEAKYKKILPTMQDSPEVAKNKLAYLKQMITADLNSYVQLQQQYGKGAGQVGGTDIQMLMGAQ